MFKVCVFGGGKIGETIAAMLGRSGRYNVKICDKDFERASRISHQLQNVTPHQLFLDDEKSVINIIGDANAVINALPFNFCHKAASLVSKTSAHYLDLTEDVETTDQVTEIAQKAGGTFIPQCGLAPGFITIAASHLAKGFDEIDSIKMRVGALPIYPSNRLKYNLTWSTEGLINEYCKMCEVIEHGEKRLAFPLEGYERFSLDGDEYEAFNTSGGIGTLCDSMFGKVKSLNYKSIRYPGHREYIAFLLHDLKFRDDRETLRQVLERSISATHQDKCIILVEVRGQIAGRLLQKTYASVIYNGTIGDRHFGAIQITTASGICAPLDLLLTGKITPTGKTVRCEEISLLDLLYNEFGQYYRDDKALKGIRS